MLGEIGRYKQALWQSDNQSTKMNKSLLAFLALLGTTAVVLYTAQPQQPQASAFSQFKTDFSKTYSSVEEEAYRKTVFLRNLVIIAEHNANPKNTHSLGITQFADLTEEEFKEMYLNAKVDKTYVGETIKSHGFGLINGDIDWVAAGDVTAVKNQANCGSCWAFSAVAAIESALLIAGNGQLLSEQQLVDCSRSYGNNGCSGGWMDSAFSYVKDHGLKSSAEYPYVARDQACAAAAGGNLKISGFVDVKGCDGLINALASRPISVAVDASNWSLYKGGVLSACGTAVNHGVLLVGATDAYWKIKNSWASSWGESGFIRLNRGNTCAVCSYPSYPTL